MNPMRLSYLYLRRHFFTTCVTVVALSIAIASVSVLFKLEMLSYARFSSMAEQGDAIVGAKSGGLDILLGALNFEGDIPGYIPQNLYETLKAKKEITFEDKSSYKDSFSLLHMTPLLIFGKYKSYTLVGTEDSFLNWQSKQLTGPVLSEGQFPLNESEALVGAGVADEESLKVGEFIYPHSRIYNSSTEGSPLKLKVVGILKTTGKMWDRGIYTNLATAQKAVVQHPDYKTIWGSHVLSYFIIDIQDQDQGALATLINQRTVSQVIFVDKEKKHLEELTGTSQGMQLLIVGILLLLAALVVLLVFFVRIEGRSIELAVLRALGYSRQELTGVLLFEGLWMGFMSLGMAIVIDLFASPQIINSVGTHSLQSQQGQGPWWSVFLTGAVVLAATVMASLPPLWRVYRQDVHSALRNIS